MMAPTEVCRIREGLWGARAAAIGVIVANVLSAAQVLAPSVVLAVGVIVGMLFLSLIAVKLRRDV